MYFRFYGWRHVLYHGANEPNQARRYVFKSSPGGGTSWTSDNYSVWLSSSKCGSGSESARYECLDIISFIWQNKTLKGITRLCNQWIRNTVIAELHEVHWVLWPSKIWTHYWYGPSIGRDIASLVISPYWTVARWNVSQWIVVKPILSVAVAWRPCLLTRYNLTRSSADAEGPRNASQIRNVALEKACNREWPSMTLKVITTAAIR